MRGYFGIGVEGIHKSQNVGTLARSAHAFGASFFFTVSPQIDVNGMKQTDTSGAFDHVPYHEFDTAENLALPDGCALVAVELVDSAVELPSFRHPTRAAYILGPEMGHLSEAVLERADFTLKIPMKFCINVGVAGAIVMYDRLLAMGKFPARPVRPGGPQDDLPPAIHGWKRRRGTEWTK